MTCDDPSGFGISGNPEPLFVGPVSNKTPHLIGLEVKGAYVNIILFFHQLYLHIHIIGELFVPR